MVFSSIVFLFYFLAPVLVLYYIVPKRFRNIVLFAASLVFYAWGEPIYVLLMLFSALFNYVCGIVIGGVKNKKAALIVNVAVNIGILVYFKYTNFLLSWVGGLFPNGAPALNIILPIGISFYTFQALSYTIDVYRGKTKVQKSFIAFGLYLALFPQLIAGPIVRYSDVARQLKRRAVTGRSFMMGFSRFCAGLCKKVIIANGAGKLWTMISGYDHSGLSAAMAWLGVIAFTIQIYFDFSGYSDMAIGLGRMFGFRFLENFNYPYISRSVTEFWRRWHMSLGTWFREYVYIPLGGNRVSRSRMYFNIFVVWMLTGLWHGASWNFVIWGLYYAAILVIEKTFLKKPLSKLPVLSNIYTMFLVMIGWAIFAVEDLGGMLQYIGAMFNFGYGGFGERDFLYNLTSYSGLLIAAAVIASGVPKLIYDALLGRRFERVKYIAAVLGFVICVAYLVDDTFNPFLYFRF